MHKAEGVLPAAIPDRTGVLLGYRCWVLRSGKIRGVGWGGHPWKLDGPTYAKCLAPRWFAQEEVGVLPSNHPHEDTPAFSCSCGLYAHYSWPTHAWAAPARVVWGAILAWGKVIHHENESFFRAGKALPIAFCRSQFPVEGLRFIAGSLAVPIFSRWAELKEYANEEAKRWT